MASDDRFKRLQARCSGFAAELLGQLENHPGLPELLLLLEEIDIESALMTLRKQPPTQIS